jgi:hypothetical protein
MNTLAAVGIAAAAGVALYFVERKTATPAAPAVPRSIPTGGSINVSGFVNRVSSEIGTGIGAATGLGAAAPVLGRASSNLVTAEYGGFRQAGSGLVSIGKGNVVTGVKDVVVGGAKTAIAPFTSAYSTIKSLL